MKLEEYLTTAEAAEMMGLTRQHVAFLCKSGELPGARKRGNTWLIPRDSVKTYKPGLQGFAAVWKNRREEEKKLAAEIKKMLHTQKNNPK